MGDLSSKDPALICAALRELGAQPPNDERISQVKHHLESKLHSVQSIAAQVLAGWRSHRSLSKLRAAFEKVQSVSLHAQRSVLAKAMAEVLRPTDTQEIIEWFLSLPTYKARFELLPTVANVDARLAKPLLEKAWATGDRDLKHSILVATSEMRKPWMLVPLGLKDSDPFIRDLAAHFANTRG